VSVPVMLGLGALLLLAPVVSSVSPPCRRVVVARSSNSDGIDNIKSKHTRHTSLNLAVSMPLRGGSQPPPPLDHESSMPLYPSGQGVNPNQNPNATPSPESGQADPFHETVQDRVDEWRTHQREQAESLQYSPRDEKGRMKLLTSVGKGSRALIFFVLMWRNIHLYEIADQTKTGVLRLLLVVPLTLLFVANLAGVVASLTSPSHSAKKRLKAILNLDKLLEVLLLVFYFIRLTIAPAKYTPREIFISNTLHSVFFLLQCQAFTRLSWDESAVPVSSYSPNQEGMIAQQQQQPQARQDEWASTQPPQTLGRQGF